MRYRAAMERKFMKICRTRGASWVESILRPLRLPGQSITVRDIPTPALRAVIQVFGQP
jgi:hypothetical protein